MCKYIPNKTRLVTIKKEPFWHQNNENFGETEKQPHTWSRKDINSLAPELNSWYDVQ